MLQHSVSFKAVPFKTVGERRGLVIERAEKNHVGERDLTESCFNSGGGGPLIFNARNFTGRKGVKKMECGVHKNFRLGREV